MNFLTEIKASKNTPIEYKLKEMIGTHTNGAEYTEKYNLKKSSLDLSPYTNVEETSFYQFNAKYFYNDEIITLAFFTGQEYGSDYFIANCFYHKTFQRSEILNNLEQLNTNINLIENDSIKKLMESKILAENILFSEELNMDLSLPILTSEGWYSSLEDSFIDCLFLTEGTNYSSRVYKEQIIFKNGFRFYESRNKIKKDDNNPETQTFLNNINFINISPYTYREAINPSELYQVDRKVKDIFIVQSIDKGYSGEITKSVLVPDDDTYEEINYDIIEENENEIKFIEDYENDIVYLLQLKDNPKEVLSLGEKIVFKDNIKTYLENERGMASNEDYILLENGDFYVHYSLSKEDYTEENHLDLIDTDINTIEFIEDINYQVSIIKSDKAIYYADRGNEWSGIEKLNYTGKGVPFFYELKSTGGYDKYTYVLPSVKLSGDHRGNHLFIEDLVNTDYLELDTSNKILVNGDFTISYERENFLISTQGRRNTPYDSFIKKSNYIFAISANKKEFTVLGLEDNKYIEIDNIYDDINGFTTIKECFKLRNLPEKIEFNKGGYSDTWIKFIYSDYFIILDYNGARTEQIV